jgi:hypothetical protein
VSSHFVLPGAVSGHLTQIVASRGIEGQDLMAGTGFSTPFVVPCGAYGKGGIGSRSTHPGVRPGCRCSEGLRRTWRNTSDRSRRVVHVPLGTLPGFKQLNETRPHAISTTREPGRSPHLTRNLRLDVVVQVPSDTPDKRHGVHADAPAPAGLNLLAATRRTLMQATRG